MVSESPAGVLMWSTRNGHLFTVTAPGSIGTLGARAADGHLTYLCLDRIRLGIHLQAHGQRALTPGHKVMHMLPPCGAHILVTCLGL